MNLKEVGHTIQIAGVIYNSDKDKMTYLLMLPDEKCYGKSIGSGNEQFMMSPQVIELDTDLWVRFFWQTDVLEAEVKTKEGKTIVRKAQRQIAGNISWKVYHRDNYACRYCGRKGIPLTVDHVVLWEDGGPSIEENLVTSCRRCNRVRGNTPYGEWLSSDDYIRFSSELPFDVLSENLNMVGRIKDIPISFHKMRGKKR